MKLFQRVILSLSLAGAGLAQTQAINGSIRGRVTDPGGSSVPLARVDVLNSATGYTRAVETGGEGYFVISNLPLGSYALTIAKPGFETERHTEIRLDAGTEAVIDIQLKVGAVTSTIEVTGGAPVLEPSRVSTGRTIDYAEIENLPLTSRNPYNFVIFQPGLSGHPNPELGIPRTLNTNGLLDRVNYQMDGMVDTETDRYGLRLFAVSDVYVREVQTVSNSFAPEFGGTAGDIFNVITNSGSNALHGEFSFIGRPPDWSARTILLASKQAQLEHRSARLRIQYRRSNQEGQGLHFRRVRASAERNAGACHHRPGGGAADWDSGLATRHGSHGAARPILERAGRLADQHQEPVLCAIRLFP
ncbi:MAG: carboxypeptidase-like regulatory domain-containing protein [Ignavibacteriota bacterium]